MQQIAALKLKKYRDRSGQYQINGVNAIEQSLSGQFLLIDKVVVERGKESLLTDFAWPQNTLFFSCSKRDFGRVSAEKSPQGVMIVARRPATSVDNLNTLKAPALYLHQVNDPGNLGAIIRTALWYGIENILLSPDSADPFQPKTVRAAAGGITHVKLFENTVSEKLEVLNHCGMILIGTKAADGEAPEQIIKKIKENWVLLMGSEAHGLPEDLLQRCHYTISLPRYGSGESLNLAVSAGICLHVLCGAATI